MAEKGRLQRRLKDIQRIRTWQLIVLLILVGFLAATFLRMNNVGMVERRNAVMNADQEGNEEVIIQRLYDLQRYVSGHMNTDLGRGVYLEASHGRAVEEWQQKQYGDSNPNGNIFKKAQNVCAPRFSSWSPSYVQCVSDELAKYPSADEVASQSSRPRQETYIYSYASPLWSPDFAGWTVAIALSIAVLIFVRLLTIGLLHLMLRRHFKNI